MGKFGILLASFLLVTFSLYINANDAAKRSAFPDIISVPNGYQPEGVVKGRGHIAYVGSLLNESIYRVNLRTGQGNLLVNNPGGTVIGLAFDQRSNHLFTAGGPFGTVSVFDAEDGEKLATYSVANDPGHFINDGIITRKAAFFTDSFAPVLYKIPLSKNGRLAEASQVETLDLVGDFEFIPGEFNGNGIEKGLKENHLILVNSVTGKLYDVNGNNGETSEIFITNGSVFSGDGLYWQHNKLYVVQNFLNQITELELSEDGNSATVLQTITHPNFQIPTTTTGFGNSLYAINSRFDVAPPPFFGAVADPSLEYHLIRVEIDK